MSRRKFFELLGVISATVLLVYAGGDLADFWQSELHFLLAISGLGMGAFFVAGRQESELEIDNG